MSGTTFHGKLKYFNRGYRNEAETEPSQPLRSYVQNRTEVSQPELRGYAETGSSGVRRNLLSCGRKGLKEIRAP